MNNSVAYIFIKFLKLLLQLFCSTYDRKIINMQTYLSKNFFFRVLLGHRNIQTASQSAERLRKLVTILTKHISNIQKYIYGLEFSDISNTEKIRTIKKNLIIEKTSLF